MSIGLALLVITAARGVGALPAGALWVAPVGCLLGVGMADFISGLVHWVADTYGDRSTAVFGHFIDTFRVHHTDPADITRHDVVEANADVFLFSTPVHCVALCFVRDGFTLSFMFGLFVASYPSSQLHKWAHLRHRPSLVAWLQRAGLLLSPERHACHHSGMHTAAYCITTGWLNPVLDAVRFFRGLEWLLSHVGIRPAPGSRPSPSDDLQLSVGRVVSVRSGTTGRHLRND